MSGWRVRLAAIRAGEAAANSAGSADWREGRRGHGANDAIGTNGNGMGGAEAPGTASQEDWAAVDAWLFGAPEDWTPSKEKPE